ncbi:MATE family efflux transporter [Candidatus Poriferisodalis sp.]|uniref:MATE family efflux transporter n=1 Tax=Candidatus Poriferisodalis sp. TaxID=3101277 RepID=UPI003B011AA4
MFRRTIYDREILLLAVPAFGALIAEPLYVLTDRAIVGRLGTPELAGLAIASAILLSAHAILIFLAYGTTGLVGRLVGAGSTRRAAEQGIAGVWLSVGLGIVVSLAMWVGSDWLVSLFDPEPEVAELALTYLRISLGGFTALLMGMAATGYLRGAQDTVTPLVIVVVSAAANVGIELLLVFELDMGIAGAAWSTVIAQWGAAIAFAVAVARRARAAGATLRLVTAAARRYARVGAQMFVRTASLRVSFVLTTVFASHIGTTEVASHEIGLQVWSFFSLALDAVAIAGQAMVAKELGASRPEVARAASVRMIGMSIQLSVVFGAAVVVLRAPIAAIFSADPDVVSLAGFLLLFVAFSQPVNAAAFAFDGIFIGAGDLGFLAWAMAGAAVGFSVVGGAVRLADLGIGWVWSALVLFMCFRVAPQWVRFRGDAWLRTGEN